MREGQRVKEKEKDRVREEKKGERERDGEEGWRDDGG